MRHWNSIAILVVLTSASCFVGEFLAGTVCERDSDCAPRYVCLFPTGTTGDSGPPIRDTATGTDTGGTGDTGGGTGLGTSTTGGPTGFCGAADLTPPAPMTGSQQNETTDTGTGTTGG
ncbi:MAG: hypothetical protein IAG13_07330 [Deltaproteobacteria bacterium]|nr:hypothetical protein [Nannocystaceae bacterium]